MTDTLTAIPAKALETHIAILGKTGSGKTNSAKVEVERLLASGGRVCVIDPTGGWFGLRLMRDGRKASPYPVVIFGGEHADVPIAGEHGAAIAEIIGASNTPAIIDTLGMTVGARTRFFTDFANALLHKNKGPLHLVIDEAHLFMPQGKVASPQSGEMLNAANNLVSLGRGRGLRITLISQRPAKLHKDSLTQVETLVAMRLIAPQDRSAVKDWVSEWADAEQSKEIIASLPSLKTGTGWLWAPELGVLDRIAFPLAETFDSSKAPADKSKGPQLAPIPLESIHERLDAVAKEVRANDPRHLKAEIARLKSEIQKLSVAASDTNRPDPQALEAARQQGFAEGVAKGSALAFEALAMDVTGRVAHVDAALRNAAEHISEAAALIKDIGSVERSMAEAIGKAKASAGAATPPPAPVMSRSVERRLAHTAPRPAPKEVNGSPLKPALSRVINAIAWWRKVGIDPVERARASVVAGYSPNASTFGVYVAELAKQGLVAVEPGKVSLTESGLALAVVSEATTREELREMARCLLKPQEQRVFDVVYEAWPNEIRRDDVALKLGLSPNASTAGVYIAAVSAYGIIEPGSRGHVRAADWLFP